MSQQEELRRTAAALAARAATVLEALAQLKGRLSTDPASVSRADVLEVQEAMEATLATSREAYLRMGLTPAAVRLIEEETARIRRVIVGEVSPEDLANSRIGALLAGMRARVSDDGGEA